jgi:hypothetical membrane protein
VSNNEHRERSLLGALLLVGAAQFILAIAITEALYLGYSAATNFLSDLGAGQIALLFNPSVALLGVCVFIGSLMGRRTLGRGLAITLAVTRACAVGTGRFPETTGAPYIVFSIAISVFGVVSAIISYRVRRPQLVRLSRPRDHRARCPCPNAHASRSGNRSSGMERTITYLIFL